MEGRGDGMGCELGKERANDGSLNVLLSPRKCTAKRKNFAQAWRSLL